MKNRPRQSQFEPAEGKAVTFSDVHGVDEAKDVRYRYNSQKFLLNMI